MLRQTGKEIPYHILFLLEYQGKYQAWVGYKEASASGSSAFKVNKYYHTEWIDEDPLPMKLDGLDIDAVYENFVKQIAGDVLHTLMIGESLKDTVAREEELDILRKQINSLQVKIRKEKQLDRQMQMNSELKILKCRLEESE